MVIIHCFGEAGQVSLGCLSVKVFISSLLKSVGTSSSNSCEKQDGPYLNADQKVYGVEKRQKKWDCQQTSRKTVDPVRKTNLRSQIQIKP